MRNITFFWRSTMMLFWSAFAMIGVATPCLGENETVSLTCFKQLWGSQIIECRADGLLFSQQLRPGCGIFISRQTRQLSPETIKQLFSRLDSFDWATTDKWDAPAYRPKMTAPIAQRGWKISYRGKTKTFAPVLKGKKEVPIKNERLQELEGIVDYLIACASNAKAGSPLFHFARSGGKATSFQDFTTGMTSADQRGKRLATNSGFTAEFEGKFTIHRTQFLESPWMHAPCFCVDFSPKKSYTTTAVAEFKAISKTPDDLHFSVSAEDVEHAFDQAFVHPFVRGFLKNNDKIGLRLLMQHDRLHRDQKLLSRMVKLLTDTPLNDEGARGWAEVILGPSRPEVKCFLNPATGKLICWENSRTPAVRLLDATGKEIKKLKLPGEEFMRLFKRSDHQGKGSVLVLSPVKAFDFKTSVTLELSKRNFRELQLKTTAQEALKILQMTCQHDYVKNQFKQHGAVSINLPLDARGTVDSPPRSARQLVDAPRKDWFCLELIKAGLADKFFVNIKTGDLLCKNDSGKYVHFVSP